jgi:hypothetical protein
MKVWRQMEGRKEETQKEGNKRKLNRKVIY